MADNAPVPAPPSEPPRAPVMEVRQQVQQRPHGHAGPDMVAPPTHFEAAIIDNRDMHGLTEAEKKSKRITRRFAKEHYDSLLGAFGVNDRPDEAGVDQLAASLGCERKRVKTWFANRRAKLARDEQKASGTMKRPRGRAPNGHTWDPVSGQFRHDPGQYVGSESKKTRYIGAGAPPPPPMGEAEPQLSNLGSLKMLKSGTGGVLAYQGKCGDDQALLLLKKSGLNPATAGTMAVQATSHETFRNDKFSKFDVHLTDTWNAELICPVTDEDVMKYSQQDFLLIREDAKLYNAVTKPFIESTGPEQLAWVYSILDGEAEAQSVLASNDDFIIYKDYKYSPDSDITEMHYLGFPKAKGVLQSIRDLRAEHVPMLQAIRDAGFAAIKEQFRVPVSKIRCYFHYLPTFYHLHIHFDHIGGQLLSGHNVGKAILVEDVIDNLLRDGDHYAKAALTFTAGASRHGKLLEDIAAYTA